MEVSPDGKDRKASGCDSKNRGEGLKTFERQVLVFPLVVVFLACASFLFGGQCAVWQWWTAAGMVVGVPFLKKGGWKAALRAAGLFGVLLVVLKGGLPPMFWDNAFGVDTRLYHFPMIQLLAEGWNPVFDPLAEGICKRLSLDLWGMAPLHVAFLNKTMAVMSAVSEKFTGDPTSATIPGLALLWLSCAFQAFRAFRGCGRWVALLAMVLVLPVMNRHIFVDEALAFASCGLLFTMVKDLQSESCDWLHLGVYSFWMMNIKLNGVLAAFVFCSLFALAVICQRRSECWKWVSRFTVFGLLLTIAWGVVSWNPLITSWHTYGHPLYPFKTTDQGKWPLQDPGWDMRVVNEDFRKMGKAGIWAHEYVSPRLVRAYYSWKSGKTGFYPERAWYKEESFIHGWVRPALWGLFAGLLLMRRGRLWGIGGLLLTILVPWDKIGYTRYEPWLSALGCLALALLADSVGKRCGKLEPWVTRGVVASMIVVIMVLGKNHARDIEFKVTECNLVRQRIRAPFWACIREPADGVNPEDFVPRYNHLTAQVNQTLLLIKQMGWADRTQVLTAEGWIPPENRFSQKHYMRRPLWKYDERAWFQPDNEKDVRCLEDLGEPWFAGNVWDGFGDPSKTEPWILTPWYRYWVPLNDHAEHVVAYYTDAEPRLGETQGKRLWRRAKAATKAWFIVYPQEAWKWLVGQQLKGNR